MRIAISGSACQGKTTLMNDFLKQWPMYKRSPESYRELIKKEQLNLNKEADAESQFKILNCLIDDLQASSSDDYIIFDRCTLDNIVYSLWAHAKNNPGVDDEFIKKCIPLIQQSMHYLDIIFFLPITKVAPVVPVARDGREIDTTYIKEIDNIFKVISHNYSSTGASPFFPDEDRPPIIEIFGNPQERIEMIKLYINESGNLVDGDSVFSNDSIQDMEQLLGIQHQLGKEEQKEKKIKDEVIKKHK